MKTLTQQLNIFKIHTVTSGFLRLKEEDRICVSTDGPWENVVKFKPPMCFSMDDAELVVDCIDRILTGQVLILPAEHLSKG